jgi:hypothetical protein
MPRQSFTISDHLAVALNRKFKPLRVLLKRESPKMPLRKIALLGTGSSAPSPRLYGFGVSGAAPRAPPG